MDERYQIIEFETEQERSTQKSKSAFAGFGRSNEWQPKIEKINKEGEKRLSALANLIALETRAQAGEEVGEALAAAMSGFQALAEEAKNRRTKLASELSDIGQMANFKLFDMLRASKAISQRVPKGKSIKIKRNSHIKSLPSINNKAIVYSKTPKVINLRQRFGRERSLKI